MSDELSIFEAENGLHDSAEPGMLDIAARYMRLLRRHSLLLGVVGLAALVLAVMHWRQQPEQFQSAASLMVRQLDPTGSNPRSAANAVADYKQMLLSDSVLIETVRRLPDTPPELAGVSQEVRWPGILRSMVTASFSDGGSILRVVCRSRDADATVDVIRTLTAVSAELMEDYQQSMSLDLVKKLDSDREALEQRLFTREKELLELRRASGDLALIGNNEQAHPIAARVAFLSNELTESRKQLMALQTLETAVADAASTGADLTPYIRELGNLVSTDLLTELTGAAAATTAAIRSAQQELLHSESEYAGLALHLGEGHPEMQRRAVELQELRSRVERLSAERNARLTGGIRDSRTAAWLLQTVRQSLDQYNRKSASLQEEFQLATEEAHRISASVAGITSIEREISTLQGLHSSLLNRLNSIDVSVAPESFRVVPLTEPMVPGSPVGPILLHSVIRFTMPALACVVALIVLIDAWADRLPEPEELTTELRLPLLSTICPLNSPVDEMVCVLERPDHFDAESFRTLRTALTLNSADGTVLCVTSSSLGEGKTTVSVNLAAAFAEAGRRTLMIDADMRRPGLSGLLQLRAHEGLSDVLRAKTPVQSDALSDSLVRVIPDSLDVLPCGSRTSNAGTLLSSPRLAELINWAAQNYDRVVVDCPPGVVSDAAVVGKLADGMLFIVNPDRSKRRQVRASLERLRYLGLNLMGLVANVSDSRSAAASQYSYQYGEGYGESDNDTPDTTDPGTESDPTDVRRVA